MEVQMEYLTVGLFCALLIFCVAANVSVLYALLAGLLLFCLYSVYKGLGAGGILEMMLSGIKTAKNVLIILAMIGALTALWRLSGTLPYIVVKAARLLTPGAVYPAAFLLCCAVSMLTGTSFGTSATMGVVCMTAGRAMGASPVILGGAILSGAFFGDRGSPVSSSAVLVSQVTDTDIFRNVKRMLLSGSPAFILSLALYFILGMILTPSGGAAADITADGFSLSPILLIPAAVILVLSALRINVKTVLAVSMLFAGLLALTVQHCSVLTLLKTALFGFISPAGASSLFDGGGLASMLKSICIITISSTYSGIFSATGLLSGFSGGIGKLAKKTGSFGALLLTSVLCCAVSCNQTLAVMLAAQLCNELYPDRSRLAAALENSAIVTAPLIPWSIAGAIPLQTVGAPGASLAAAFFLWLVPLTTLLCPRLLGKRE